MSLTQSLRVWTKRRESPLADTAYRLARASLSWSMPVIPGLHRPLLGLHQAIRSLLSGLLRVAWYTPLFQSRLGAPAPGLYLYGGLPLVLGPLDINVGAKSRISAQTTFTGRTAPGPRPMLKIGSNVDIGWQTTIAVGHQVTIGDNVRIAGRALLAGYPGHPVDAFDRAAGYADTPDQIGNIVLEDDVWLATGVTVLAGVRIGRGTIVGAGSVVTRDLPAGVMAAGIPARIVRALPVREENEP